MADDPHSVIAETVSDIRRCAGAYSQHAFLLATADMVAFISDVHAGPDLGVPCRPENCSALAAALKVCEAWRSVDRTEATR